MKVGAEHIQRKGAKSFSLVGQVSLSKNSMSDSSEVEGHLEPGCGVPWVILTRERTTLELSYSWSSFANGG